MTAQNELCTGRYGITFPQYSKIDVNGENAIPLYKWLTENTKFAGFSGPMGLVLSPIVKKMDKDYKNNGNLKTIPVLLEGWSVDQIESKLSGIVCGRRGTSCSDQLAKAVRAARNASLDPNYKSPLEEDEEE